MNIHYTERNRASIGIPWNTLTSFFVKSVLFSQPDVKTSRYNLDINHSSAEMILIPEEP